MTTFVDTSAFIALFDRADRRHADAIHGWQLLASRDGRLLTSNFVVLETVAVLQRRLGMDAARGFAEGILPVLEVVYVDEAMQTAALSALLTAGRRQLSLVDCVSFEVMRQRRLSSAFAFDRHFDEMGYRLE